MSDLKNWLLQLNLPLTGIYTAAGPLGDFTVLDLLDYEKTKATKPMLLEQLIQRMHSEVVSAPVDSFSYKFHPIAPTLLQLMTFTKTLAKLGYRSRIDAPRDI